MVIKAIKPNAAIRPAIRPAIKPAVPAVKTAPAVEELDDEVVDETAAEDVTGDAADEVVESAVDAVEAEEVVAAPAAPKAAAKTIVKPAVKAAAKPAAAPVKPAAAPKAAAPKAAAKPAAAPKAAEAARPKKPGAVLGAAPRKFEVELPASMGGRVTLDNVQELWFRYLTAHSEALGIEIHSKVVTSSLLQAVFAFLLGDELPEGMDYEATPEAIAAHGGLLRFFEAKLAEGAHFKHVVNNRRYRNPLSTSDADEYMNLEGRRNLVLNTQLEAGTTTYEPK